MPPKTQNPYPYLGQLFLKKRYSFLGIFPKIGTQFLGILPQKHTLTQYPIVLYNVKHNMQIIQHNLFPQGGKPLLHLAVELNHQDLVKRLILSGANVAETDQVC